METFKGLPLVIKLMIVFVFIDVIATMTFFYLDTMNDPEIDFFDIENLLSFIFPIFYFAGMVWLIKTHIPITKIIIYLVFSLEFAAFMIEVGSVEFDIYSFLSLASIFSLLGCIYIILTDVGKEWFSSKNKG